MNDFTICGDPNRRHDFIYVFDVQDGNPNGDPDAGNMPRVDPETMHGLVTDVCLKRKVRNYVSLAKEGADGFAIYVNDQGIPLNTLHQQAYDTAGLKSTGSKQKREDISKVRDVMCGRFWDIRTFGAVMTTGVNAGQVRGPVQLTFSRSVHPIAPLDTSITRVAITKPEDAEVVEADESTGQKAQGKATEMGSKWAVPYGLYVGHGFFSPHFAGQTGVDRDDLELLWSALMGMMDLDHSSARGLMSARGLYVFSHDNKLGNAPAYALFDRFSAACDSDAPRSFADYRVSLEDGGMPEGVTLTRLIG